MITQRVSYEKLKAAIRVAFQEDKDIFKYFDPNVKVETIDDVINNIHQKISEYESPEMYSVLEKGKLVGFIVSKENRLISFGLSVEYRFSKHLKSFFNTIKEIAGSKFYCLLWSRNIRAAKWLMKNGMCETLYDNNIIKLHCL